MYTLQQSQHPSSNPRSSRVAPCTHHIPSRRLQQTHGGGHEFVSSKSSTRTSPALVFFLRERNTLVLLLKETSTSTGQAYRRGANTLERELLIPWATSSIRWDWYRLHHTQLRSSWSTAPQHQRSLPRRRSSQSTAAAPTPSWAL